MTDIITQLQSIADHLPECAPAHQACKDGAHEIEQLRALAKSLSNALLTVAPLGGSECFIHRCGDYYADPEWFKRRIWENREREHEARKRAMLAERALETATAHGQS